MDDATDRTPDNALPLPELVEARLAGDRKLTEPAKVLIREALGDSRNAEDGARTSAGPLYLGKVTVTGFRGVGSETRLKLKPKPGVTLVVGRNGSGKSSIAEAIETLFTGTNAHCTGRHPSHAVRWRNLHQGERAVVEARLTVEGDPAPSTLTRTWTGDAFTDSEAVLRRPGHGTVPLEQAGWEQATRAHRPFLSYADLDDLINGKPSEMYDNIAAILGLDALNAAARRLTAAKKELDAVVNAAKDRKPLLHAALEEVGHDDRALKALVAMEEKGGPDHAVLDALIASASTADEGRLREARLEAAAEAESPVLDRVGARRRRAAERRRRRRRPEGHRGRRRPQQGRTAPGGAPPQRPATPTTRPARSAARNRPWTGSGPRAPRRRSPPSSVRPRPYARPRPVCGVRRAPCTTWSSRPGRSRPRSPNRGRPGATADGSPTPSNSPSAR
ncbi:hypothetical protein GCM10023238_29830 [Streptomyces heliomycini]